MTDGARAAQALCRELGPPTPAGLACTAAGRALRAIGRAEDVRACAVVDDLAVVPVWRDGALVSDRGCQGGEEDV